ncbi:MAG: hypothetical protein ACI9QL_005216 [Candidatus Omnitrophota bacterium]|jgi:hypothetical protein
MTFFDSVDPVLFEELPNPNPKALGWPTKEYDWGNTAPKGNIIVVRESLMCYNQVNDRKGGNILKIDFQKVEQVAEGRCFIRLRSFTHSVESIRRDGPALHPGRGFLFRVSLGWHPSLPPPDQNRDSSPDTFPRSPDFRAGSVHTCQVLRLRRSE